MLPLSPVDTLVAATTFVLLSLAVYQTVHHAAMVSSRAAAHRSRPVVFAAVAGGWATYGALFVSAVVATDSYVDALPLVIVGLYAPTIASIAGLALSARFRRFAASLPLRWLVSTVEGWPRMIVGVIFLMWYFAGELPPVFALVAGPGDWISGFLARRSMARLQSEVPQALEHRAQWSGDDLADHIDLTETSRRQPIIRAARIVWLVVILGIADFIAAPASSAVSIQIGSIPESMGQFPMALIPLLLVPQVLVLEVLALYQLRTLRRSATRRRTNDTGPERRGRAADTHRAIAEDARAAIR